MVCTFYTLLISCNGMTSVSGEWSKSKLPLLRVYLATLIAKNNMPLLLSTVSTSITILS